MRAHTHTHAHTMSKATIGIFHHCILNKRNKRQASFFYLLDLLTEILVHSPSVWPFKFALYCKYKTSLTLSFHFAPSRAESSQSGETEVQQCRD